MTQTIKVMVQYTITQNGYTFQDALYYDPTVYAAMTPEQIQSEQQARFDNWYAVVTAPPTPAPDSPPDTPAE